MTLADTWWALRGRLDGLWCLLRRHDVDWRASSNDIPGCSGDIVCHTCERVHWCRWYDRPNRRQTDDE
jgi:hypothetical protein